MIGLESANCKVVYSEELSEKINIQYLHVGIVFFFAIRRMTSFFNLNLELDEHARFTPPQRQNEFAVFIGLADCKKMEGKRKKIKILKCRKECGQSITLGKTEKFSFSMQLKIGLFGLLLKGLSYTRSLFIFLFFNFNPAFLSCTFFPQNFFRLPTRVATKFMW